MRYYLSKKTTKRASPLQVQSCHSGGIIPEEYPRTGLFPEKAPVCGEVCVASEVFLRKVKFVYDK